jgi:hypothetical protein
MNRIERADAAMRVQRVIQFIAACVLMFVAFFGMGYLAIVGQELKEARINAEAVKQMGMQR